jgi:hypothetical protein
MYTPPHLKHLQSSNGGNHQHSNNGNNSVLNRQQNHSGGYNNSPLSKMFGRSTEDNVNKAYNTDKPKANKPKQLSLSDYKDSVKSKLGEFVKNIDSDSKKVARVITIETVKTDERPVDKIYSNPTDFWSDIYNFTKDPEQKVNLSWNHSISKDAMIKLLQEQGTIKFNPIQYYQNTIQSQENVTKNISDKLRVNISRGFIKYLSVLTIHNINSSNIQEMITIAQDIIEESGLTESIVMNLWIT